jgi:nuclear pore complex protein Nup62
MIAKIAQLYNQVLTAETQQQQIDSTLSSVEAQQDELSNALDMYEKQAKDVLEGQSGALKILDSSPADAERDKK